MGRPSFVLLAAGALGIATIAGGWSGCKSDSECERDDECGSAAACTGRICVARIGATPLSVAVELEPAPESPHARWDYPAVTFTSAAMDLAVDRKVAMTAALASTVPGPTDQASTVRVVVSVASELPGRPDLTFEADGVNAAMGPYEVDVALPEHLLGRVGQLRVLPVAPIDRIICPWQLDVTLATAAMLSLPGASDSVLIDGTVVATAAPGASAPGYEARLFAGNRLLSNVAQTDPGGRFQLRAQRSLLAGRTDARIEVAPTDPDGPPAILSLPYSGGTSLGTLRIPPTPQPLPFVIPVLEAATQAPVVGATVKVSTGIEGTTVGQARYVRVAQTGMDGNATISLLPGSGGVTRDYLVSVVPPAASTAGSLCVASYAIGAAVGNGAMPRFGAALLLPRKAALQGQLLRDNGRPAGGMRVRATRIGDLTAAGCGAMQAFPPSEDAADAEGQYLVRLDPGDYRLEIEPPPDSGFPRHVVPSVTVGESAILNIALPSAVLLEGRVVGPGAVASAGTEVRIFAPTSAGETLLGTTLAGLDGRFRLVVQRP